MTQISLYNPKRSSTIIHVDEGSDYSDLAELGFRPFHENNKNVLFVDWQPLFDWINKQLYTSIKFDIDLTGRRPEIVSPNLLANAGVFASVCETVEVGFFNLCIDELGFAAGVDLFYKSWRGGNNGMPIGDIYYNHQHKQWDFRSTKQIALTNRLDV